MCAGAKGFIDMPTANAYHKEQDASRAYLKQQDMQYIIPPGGDQHITPMFGHSIADSLGYQAPINPKQWILGQIKYTYYDEDNRFKTGYSPFMIYCEEKNVLTHAMAQFIQPDSFKAVIGLKVWGTHHTRDNRQNPC
jgi:hypothetical protein